MNPLEMFKPLDIKDTILVSEIVYYMVDMACQVLQLLYRRVLLLPV